uniref:Hedgehog protein Hint domain-containing protein n=1 Tax=viral metagenome TaxID=1070528 RepID=A0A6C0AZM3_9ZZZZ
MPKGLDWFNFIYVQIGFIAQIFIMFYFSAISEIKKDWPKYRCNPIFMPLSDNIQKDFTFCIQSMQTNFMGYLLQPINYILNVLSSMGGEFTDSLNLMRTMISSMRSMVTSVFQNIFGVFLNLIIEFQKITIGIKDLVGKIIGIMVTLMYMIDGSVKTMQSTWNGPPGQMVKALGGMCFHPDTRVKLSNGKSIKMSELNLGDCLENNSRIDVIMKVDNKFYEVYYKLITENGQEILVTGTHMIFYEKENKFIEVKNHPDAIKTEECAPWFCSFITDDHKIQIENYLFWDWEDDVIKM